ncbi:MAG: PHP domain-containing protein [Desulfobacteraceae bacterium]|nr:PHP domain-containing protein [Desulfobacteraceae bacterium]
MNQPPYADLHNHTTASDGDFSPEQLVLAAKDAGISALGVTDHDTLDGLAQALYAGKRHSIEVVPGVEVSVKFKRPFFTGTLHLLCYFPEGLLKAPGFRESLSRTLAQGRGPALVARRVHEINRCFGPMGNTPLLERDLTVEEIHLLSANASRRHFGQALSRNHGINDPERVNRIIGNKSPAYLPSGIDLDTVKPVIDKFPILAVLAHPAAGSFPGEGHYKEVLPPMEIVEQLLPEFLDAGVQGLEINYPGHIPGHRRTLNAWAAKHGLVATGGSDCHDAVNRPIGVEGIPESAFHRFKAKIPPFQA